MTVGSQVGLLGEWGALKSQPTPGQEKLETPSSIVDWLNIYDPDDLLSFFAEPIFNRVLDIPVTTGVPFPISHSEYWNLPLVYKILAGQIPS